MVFIFIKDIFRINIYIYIEYAWLSLCPSCAPKNSVLQYDSYGGKSSAIPLFVPLKINILFACRLGTLQCIMILISTDNRGKLFFLKKVMSLVKAKTFLMMHPLDHLPFIQNKQRAKLLKI